jgi:hypothetical protein
VLTFALPSLPIRTSVWAAKTPTVPVQMHVTSFGNQKGLIVTLDDEGGLAVSYLGEYPRCVLWDVG